MNLELQTEDNQLPSRFQIGDEVMVANDYDCLEYYGKGTIVGILFWKDKVVYIFEKWNSDRGVVMSYVLSKHVHPLKQ